MRERRDRGICMVAPEVLVTVRLGLRQDGAAVVCV